jgi:hypothetical protein
MSTVGCELLNSTGRAFSCLQNVPMALNCAAVCYCALTHLMTYTAC